MTLVPCYKHIAAVWQRPRLKWCTRARREQRAGSGSVRFRWRARPRFGRTDSTQQQMPHCSEWRLPRLLTDLNRRIGRNSVAAALGGIDHRGAVSWSERGGKCWRNDIVLPPYPGRSGAVWMVARRAAGRGVMVAGASRYTNSHRDIAEIVLSYT